MSCICKEYETVRRKREGENEEGKERRKRGKEGWDRGGRMGGRRTGDTLAWSERRWILASYCSQQPERTWTIHEVHMLSPDTGRNIACWMMALIRELFPAPVLPNKPM